MHINGDQAEWGAFDKTQTTFIQHQNTCRTGLCIGEIDVMLKKCGTIVIFVDIFLGDDDDDFLQTNSMQNDDTNTEKES